MSDSVFHYLMIGVQVFFILVTLAGGYKHIIVANQNISTVMHEMTEVKLVLKEHGTEIIEIQNSLAFDAGVAKGKAAKNGS